MKCLLPQASSAHDIPPRADAVEAEGDGARLGAEAGLVHGIAFECKLPKLVGCTMQAIIGARLH
jgi:hypothetical protein